MRRAVRFYDSVRHIVRKHASGGDACVFVEASRNSTVTAMSARVVGERDAALLSRLEPADRHRTPKLCLTNRSNGGV